jgi:hypothetical protein
MLPHVTRLSLVLIALLLPTVLLARWAGEGNEPSDARVAALALCGDQPCIWGLVPGQTEWASAQQSLAGAGARTIYRQIEPAGEFGFFPSVDRISLGRVSITLAEPMQAGWIVQRFGAPCGVSIYWEMDIVTLRYPALLANVGLTGDGLHLSDPVTSIHLADPHFHLDRQPDLCLDSHSPHAVYNTVWMGFAPYRRYRDVRLGFSRL